MEKVKELYRTLQKRNLIAGSFALIVAVDFLYSVLTPPSYFNFLPLGVHQSFFREVTVSGEVINRIDEGTFIKVFNTVVASLIFVVVYRVSRIRAN